MKAFVTILMILSFCVLTGCNNMYSFASVDATDNQNTATCCNDVNYQSGYYYNGYKENGWRYCVVKPN